MVKLLLSSLLIFSLSSFAEAQVSARASTDKKNYEVGDYINYTIRVRYDEGVKIRNPLMKGVLNSIELIKEGEPVHSKEDEKYIVTFNYILSKYDSGDVTIPSIVVGYIIGNDTTRHSAVTNPVSITVHTLKVILEEEIKDVKAPIRIPLDWKIIALWILGILIILGLIYYFYRKYQERKKQLPVKRTIPKIPHYVTALNALRELEKEKLWQNGHIKEYHSKVTEIIRRYFEERFYLPALELTTKEAMDHLSRKKEAQKILVTTEEFLNNADLVKFAKYKPMSSVNEEMMKQAYNIVESTIPADRDEKKEMSDVH
jgi:hypothetical protein